MTSDEYALGDGVEGRQTEDAATSRWLVLPSAFLFVANASSRLSCCDSDPQSLLSPIRRPGLYFSPKESGPASCPTPCMWPGLHGLPCLPVLLSPG